MTTSEVPSSVGFRAKTSFLTYLRNRKHIGVVSLGHEQDILFVLAIYLESFHYGIQILPSTIRQMTSFVWTISFDIECSTVDE